MQPEQKRLLESEIARRRTFAIISHPDAGKTTLTEKLLLYGGAIHLAGSVKARRAGRAATSDWMALEKERGISISTSVMQFEYQGRHFNLLDTPGHNDFSEDTYRTLAAADCAVMLLDCVKGVEPQTIKLFEVCRLRGIPIVTFINKLDRYGKAPLDLLGEIEQVLGIPTSPIMWPVGAGTGFQGVFDRRTREFFRFARGDAGERASMRMGSLDDPELVAELGPEAHAQLKDEIDLLDEAGNAFDRDRFLAGKVTPVFFGSAMTNFGVEPFLGRFTELCPAPRARTTAAGDVLAPDSPKFSGFVFKIQANMDPNHRDRVAFVRICSGRFTRGMEVSHARTGKKLVLSRSLNFLAQERVLVEEAFSGDILGVWDPGVLRIGDSLYEGSPKVEFDGIPRFSPEHFVRVRLADPMRRKQLAKGLEQLAEEGAVLLLFDRDARDAEPILGTVGPLQFEVVQHRLKTEYGVDARFDRLAYQQARWVEGDGFVPNDVVRQGIACVRDVEERPILLFDTDWLRRHTEEKYPGLTFIAAAQPGRAQKPGAAGRK